MTFIVQDKDLRSDVPCVASTRFAVAQIIAELADGQTVAGLCADMDLDQGMVEGSLNELASFINRPFAMRAATIHVDE